MEHKITIDVNISINSNLSSSQSPSQNLPPQIQKLPSFDISQLMPLFVKAFSAPSVTQVSSENEVKK